MKTSQNSQLTISVFYNKDAANRAVHWRDTHLFENEMADLFAHKRAVNCVDLVHASLTNLVTSWP